MIKKLLGKFAEPTTEAGSWIAHRETLFWHDDGPHAVKYAIEKLTGTLLQRDPHEQHGLVYTGTSGGGDAREVSLRFEAVVGHRKLYRLALTLRSPRKWVREDAHLQSVERIFSFWCGKLDRAAAGTDPARGSSDAFEACRRESLALEEAASRVVEDPAPVHALQREVMDALRNGMGFFTANKEGGSHLFFNGQVFVRSDYGDEPNIYETYADEAGMAACLRQFYDWEARRGHYPHMPPEREVWMYIRSQLSKRHV
jgi:hypothetical protein